MGTQILIDDSKRDFFFFFRQRDGAVDQTAIKQGRKSPQSSLYKHVAIGTSRQQQRAKCKFQTQISNLPHAPTIWMLFWRLIPPTTPLFVPFLLGFQTDSFSPPKKILYVSYIYEGKKRQITSDSRFPPRLPSNSTLLLSSQLYSLPACLPLSALFHGEQRRRSAVPVRNYAPCTVGSALRAGKTEECR